MRQVVTCQFAMSQHRVDMRQTGLWTIAHPQFIGATISCTSSISAKSLVDGRLVPECRHGDRNPHIPTARPTKGSLDTGAFIGIDLEFGRCALSHPPAIRLRKDHAPVLIGLERVGQPPMNGEAADRYPMNFITGCLSSPLFQFAGPAKRIRLPSGSFTMKVLACHGSFLRG